MISSGNILLVSEVTFFTQPLQDFCGRVGKSDLKSLKAFL